MADFQQLQRQLTAHLRDPQANPAPEGPEDRRLAIYRRLVFGNVSRLLAANFPLARKQLGKDAFSALIQHFLREHRAETPYFPRLAGELQAWYQKAQPQRTEDPPWLGELILYESEKRRIRNISDPALDPMIDPQGDVISGIPAPSPLLRLLTLRHPVHKAKSEELVLDENRKTGRELLETMLEQAPPDSRPALMRQGEAGLRRFHRIGVLLGAYRKDPVQ